MTLFLLCLKIFFARIADVSLGTLRTVLTVRGKTLVSGIIAFFEVTIWFLVAREALNTDLESIFIVISYAGGYATGTIIGTLMSSKFINRIYQVEVVSSIIKNDEINELRKEGYGISILSTKDSYNGEDKNILRITVKSKSLNKLKKSIISMDKDAFIVVNESKIVLNGYIK